MSRRSKRKKSSSANPIVLIVIAVLAIGVVAGGYYLITQNKGGMEELPAHNGDLRSLVGNKYQVTGEVTQIVRNSNDRIVVSVQQDDRPHEVQIDIAKEIDGPNINAKQSYIFSVEIVEGGFIQATSYTDR